MKTTVRNGKKMAVFGKQQYRESHIKQQYWESHIKPKRIIFGTLTAGGNGGGGCTVTSLRHYIYTYLYL